MAVNTVASSSYMVRMSTRTSGAAARIRRVASTPSMPGIRTSIRRTSGRCCSASVTAASPSAASPTTSMPSIVRSRATRPPLTTGWSSATRMRIPAGSIGQAWQRHHPLTRDRLPDWVPDSCDDQGRSDSRRGNGGGETVKLHQPKERPMTTRAPLTTTSTPPTLAARVRVGLVLSVLLGLQNIPLLFLDINWGTTPPPKWLLGLQALFGLVSIVAAAVAWRSGSRMAIRVDAAFLIVNGLMTVPGFFLDISAGLKLLTSATVLLTVLAVVLMMGRDRDSLPV